VALNRAVALAEVEGPEAALAVVDTLDLPTYYLLHAIRADLLTRLGRTADARAAYETALSLTTNQAEVDFLSARLSNLQ
jgi:RNA polymerase sigma-70 factor (ECF subfamily)